MKINIEKLIRNDEIIISKYDIFYSCTDANVRDEIYQYVINNIGMSDEDKINFIKENSNGIDLERVLLYGILGKEIDIKQFSQVIQEKIAKSNISVVNNTIKKLADDIEIKRMQERLQNEKRKLEKLKKANSGLKICIATSFFNSDTNQPDIEILDSRSVLGQKLPDREQKLQKFDDFFEQLRHIQGSTINGLTAFSYLTPLREIVGIFPSPEFSQAVFNYSLNLAAWKSGLKTIQEIEKAREDGEKFYKELLTGKEEKFIIEILYPSIRKYIEYADMDQLVMVGAYRLQEKLETGTLPKEDVEVIKQVLQQIVKYCKENKIPSTYKIKLLRDSENWEPEKQVPYSVNDINKCLDRFMDGVYINNAGIDNLRKAVNDGKLFLMQIHPNILKSMYHDEEYKYIMFLNDRNFKYTVSVANLSREQILTLASQVGFNSVHNLNLLLTNNVLTLKDIQNLYMTGMIDKNIALEAMQGKDKEGIIEFVKLKDLYEYGKREHDKEIQERYAKYLDFCKSIIDQAANESIEVSPETTAQGENESAEISSEMKEQEENESAELSPEMTEQEKEEKMLETRKKFSEEFMMVFVESSDSKNEEQYIDQLENFYKEGLLDIETIIDWADESIVARFLQDRVIDSTVIKKLMQDKTITVAYAQSLFGECILDPNMDSQTRIGLIRSGLISEKYIGKAYQEALIKTSDAESLTDEGYFDKNKYENISIEELQAKSKIKLGDLRSLTKIKTEFSKKPFGKRQTGEYQASNPTIIIDPNAREDLFELLGARKAESLEIQPGDPFYNYEFYVLPDENGEYGPNSVVIAERYYMNKDTMKTFATANATYFFKWRDLLYLSHLKKSEIAKESKDIVFRANHVVSDAKDKMGSWGNGVLTAIGKTMMGKRVRKYKSKEKLAKVALEKVKAMYKKEQWEKIESKADNIDLGMHNIKDSVLLFSTDDSDPHSDGLR